MHKNIEIKSPPNQVDAAIFNTQQNYGLLSNKVGQRKSTKNTSVDKISLAYVGSRATALKLGIGSKKELNAERERQATLPQIQQGITIVQPRQSVSKGIRLKTHQGHSNRRKKPSSLDSRANDLIFQQRHANEEQVYTDRIPALDLKKTSAADTSNETNQVDYVSRNKFSDSPVGTLNKGKGPMTPINEYNNRDGTNSLLPKDL